MQSEEFDKKINEAAEHHHPSYNEGAWNKMEQLLDKHLPQKKDDRRKYILILFLFLFTGGGLYLMLAKPWKENKPISSSMERSAGTVPVNPSGVVIDKKRVEDISGKIKSSDNVAPNAGGNAESTSIDADDNTKNSNDYFSIASKKRSVTKNIKDKGVARRDGDLSHKDIPDKDNRTNKSNQEITPVLQDNRSSNNIIGNTPKKAESESKTAEKNINDVSTSAPENKKENATPVSVKKIKANTSKRNTFFFTLSAGADIASIQFQENGKLKPVIGIGAGYTIHKRFTLRTGFYSARKIYETSKQYSSLASLPMNWNYLSQIDADCKVYEIPLALSYNFGFSKKHNWFVSTGLSSYLMKKEKYKYEYTYPSGARYSYTHTVNNENKHYFSILTLSGGYTKKIGNRLSLTAEPYVKIPLTGIGYGNVKLNSAGLLFSVSINPFNSGKK